jgi:hypothetical protein
MIAVSWESQLKTIQKWKLLPEKKGRFCQKFSADAGEGWLRNVNPIIDTFHFPFPLCSHFQDGCLLKTDWEFSDVVLV